ncbi:hypothetical protein V6N13_098291 [Hibiscus sabdariffa]
MQPQICVYESVALKEKVTDYRLEARLDSSPNMTVRGNERSGGVHVKPVARSTPALPQSSIGPPRTDDPAWLTHALMYFRSYPQMKR